MTIVTKAGLAAELDVTRTRVSQYVKMGMPVRRDGRVDREQALHWIANQFAPATGEDKGAVRAYKLLQDGMVRSRQGRRHGHREQTTSRAYAGNGAGMPECPIVRQAKRFSNPVDAGVVVGVLALAYRVPALAAVLAVGAGAPMRSAFALYSAMIVAIARAADEIVEDIGVCPADKMGFTSAGFDLPAWDYLADVEAQEPVDMPAWEQWRAHCFGEGSFERAEAQRQAHNDGQ